MPKSRSFYIFVAVFLIATSTMYYKSVPNHGRQKDLTACKTNLKNIGTAMEMYATDWSGRYPPNLETLVPEYLDELPSCPAAGEFRYAFEGSESERNINRYRDYFYLYCQGEHHTAVGVPGNLPAFDSVGEPESSYRVHLHNSVSGRSRSGTPHHH